MKNILTLLFLPSLIFAQELSYIDGAPILTFFEEKVEVSMNLSKERQYGKYYIADITIFNNTGNNLDVNPRKVQATIIRKGKIKDAEVLSHSEYIKKVKTRQTWQAVGKAVGEYSDAADAGKTTSQTRSSSYGTYNVNANTSYSNRSGSNLGSSRTRGTISGHSTTNSTTTTHDGGAQYMAEQNAERKVEDFQNRQAQIADVINQGYLKRHTLKNQEYIRGNLNIKYKKADEIELVIPVNGKDYIFIWDKDLLEGN